jgi:hypothetical protein
MASIDNTHTVDFGKMPPRVQQRVIRRSTASPHFRSELRALNPSLGGFRAKAADFELCCRNRRLLMSAFGPQRYADRLTTMYNKVCCSIPHHDIRGIRIMEKFLSPELLFPH